MNTTNDVAIEKVDLTSEISAQTRAGIEQAQPMWKMVLSQFVEHRLAVAGAVVISLFLFVAIFAGTIQVVTGLDPDAQNVANRYVQPLSTVEVGQDVRETAIERYIGNHEEAAMTVAKALIAQGTLNFTEEDVLYELAAGDVTEGIKALEGLHIPEATGLIKTFKDFSTFHLFGTDELGRDVFIRLVYGTRVSMGVGILVALASALVGLLVGSLAGFYGGLIDTVLMRVTDALLSLPTIPVLIVMAAIDFSKLPIVNNIVSTSNESVFKMVIILCMFSWMTVARLVRGSILSIREREFVLAAKTLGAKDSTIIIRHMFPNVIAPMLVSITLGVGESILFEAALSFLGLGIMPPTPSWGNMLNNAQELIYQAPFLAVLPGVLILLTTISFNYLGDGLQDAIDPKAIRR